MEVDALRIVEEEPGLVSVVADPLACDSHFGQTVLIEVLYTIEVMEISCWIVFPFVVAILVCEEVLKLV